MKVKLQDGKYLYIFDEMMGSATVISQGKCRDVTGDEFILAMAERIHELEEKLNEQLRC